MEKYVTQIQSKVQGESGVYFSLNYPGDVAQIGHKRGCCVNFYR